MKPKQILLVLIMAIMAISLQSCATAFGGRSNSVKFHADSDPVAAEIFLDGDKIGMAPGKIKLSKGKIQHGSILEIKAEGYKTQEYMIFLKLSPWYALADLFTVAPTIIVDFATGDIYRPKPRSFKYKLEKKN